MINTLANALLVENVERIQSFLILFDSFSLKKEPVKKTAFIQ